MAKYIGNKETKRLKTMEKYKSVRTKSGQGCVPYFNYRAMSGKSMAFWIGGCFRRWSHMEVPLYSIKTSIKDTCLAPTS